MWCCKARETIDIPWLFGSLKYGEVKRKLCMDKCNLNVSKHSFVYYKDEKRISNSDGAYEEL